jgi:hypothetical protein
LFTGQLASASWLSRRIGDVMSPMRPKTELTDLERLSMPRQVDLKADSLATKCAAVYTKKCGASGVPKTH